MLPEIWGKVIKICRVHGVRSWEVELIAVATNNDSKPQDRATKVKTFYTRRGIKEDTDPRFLEAVAVMAPPSA